MSETSRHYFISTKDKLGDIPAVTMGFVDPQNPERSLEVEIVPAIGSVIRSFKVGKDEIVACNNQALLGQKENGPWEGIFTLAPFLAGRQRDSRGMFQGRPLDGTVAPRPVSLDDSALVHGTARAREWTMEASDAESQSPFSFKTQVRFGKDEKGAKLPFYEAYPFDVLLTHEHVLTSQGLRVYAAFENLDVRPAPIGHALHANFKRDDQTKILVPAASYLPLDQDLLPVLPAKLETVAGTKYDLRELTSINGLALNDFLTGLDRKQPVIYDPTDKPFTVKISASHLYKYCVVFTGMDDSVSLEMQTHSPDPLTLYDKGPRPLANVIVLQSGARVAMYTDYQIQHRPEAQVFAENRSPIDIEN